MVTLEEFLAMPEEKPYFEYWDGKVIQKTGYNVAHAVMHGAMLFHLSELRQGHAGFRVLPELTHLDIASECVYLPDISVRLTDRDRDESHPVRTAPDFAIEILSEYDSAGLLARRIAGYCAFGVRLIWLVDPGRREITVFQRGADPFVATEGTFLNAAPVLPGFQVDVSALFAALDE